MLIRRPASSWGGVRPARNARIKSSDRSPRAVAGSMLGPSVLDAPNAMATGNASMSFRAHLIISHLISELTDCRP